MNYNLKNITQIAEAFSPRKSCIHIRLVASIHVNYRFRKYIHLSARNSSI